MEYVFAFSNTHEAIYAEQVLKTAEIKIRVMALPSQISAGCGICLRLDAPDLDIAHQLLSEHEIPIHACFTAQRKDGGMEYHLCQR